MPPFCFASAATQLHYNQMIRQKCFCRHVTDMARQSCCSFFRRSAFNFTDYIKIAGQQKPFLRSCQRFHSNAIEREAVANTGERWQLLSAVCLQRLPSLTQELSPIEDEFNALQQRLEYENSYLSNHELRHLADLDLAERRKSEDHEDTEIEAMRRTALDDQDVWEAELQAFSMNSRITEADRKQDKQSVQRALSSRLTLVARCELGEHNYWLLPMGAHHDGESMRDTAERVLDSTCGSGLAVKFMGHAPCGFYKYKFPQNAQDVGDYTGAKVFFFKAQYQTGNVLLSPGQYTEYQWATASELAELMDPAYHKAVSRFQLDL